MNVKLTGSDFSKRS